MTAIATGVVVLLARKLRLLQGLGDHGQGYGRAAHSGQGVGPSQGGKQIMRGPARTLGDGEQHVVTGFHRPEPGMFAEDADSRFQIRRVETDDQTGCKASDQALVDARQLAGRASAAQDDLPLGIEQRFDHVEQLLL